MTALVVSLLMIAPAGAVDFNRRGVLAGLSSLALPKWNIGFSTAPVATLDLLDAGLRPEMWRRNPQVNGMLRGLPAVEAAAARDRLIALENVLPSRLGVSPEVVRRFFDRTFFVCLQRRQRPLPLAGHEAQVIAAVRDIQPALGDLLERWVDAVRDYERAYPNQVESSVFDWRLRVWATPKLKNVLFESGRADGPWDPRLEPALVEVVGRIDALERSIARESGLPLEVVWEHSFFLDADRAEYPRQFVDVPPVRARLRRGLDRILPSLYEELTGEAAAPAASPTRVSTASLRFEVLDFLKVRDLVPRLAAAAPEASSAEEPGAGCDLLLEHRPSVPLVVEVPESVEVEVSESP